MRKVIYIFLLKYVIVLVNWVVKSLRRYGPINFFFTKNGKKNSVGRVYTRRAMAWVAILVVLGLLESFLEIMETSQSRVEAPREINNNSESNVEVLKEKRKISTYGDPFRQRLVLARMERERLLDPYHGEMVRKVQAKVEADDAGFMYYFEAEEIGNKIQQRNTPRRIVGGPTGVSLELGSALKERAIKELGRTTGELERYIEETIKSEVNAKKGWRDKKLLEMQEEYKKVSAGKAAKESWNLLLNASDNKKYWNAEIFRGYRPYYKDVATHKIENIEHLGNMLRVSLYDASIDVWLKCYLGRDLNFLLALKDSEESLIGAERREVDTIKEKYSLHEKNKYVGDISKMITRKLEEKTIDEKACLLKGQMEKMAKIAFLVEKTAETKNVPWQSVFDRRPHRNVRNLYISGGKLEPYVGALPYIGNTVIGELKSARWWEVSKGESSLWWGEYRISHTPTEYTHRELRERLLAMCKGSYSLRNYEGKIMCGGCPEITRLFRYCKLVSLYGLEGELGDKEITKEEYVLWKKYEKNRREIEPGIWHRKANCVEYPEESIIYFQEGGSRIQKKKEIVTVTFAWQPGRRLFWLSPAREWHGRDERLTSFLDLGIYFAFCSNDTSVWVQRAENNNNFWAKGPTGSRMVENHQVDKIDRDYAKRTEVREKTFFSKVKGYIISLWYGKNK
jgi:hypothetical protein